MALVGNMIDDAFSGNPSSVNYVMFTAAFSMFTLIYLIAGTLNPDWAIHPIIMIAVDALNCIFFFCAAIALAARLGAHSCSNPVCNTPLKIAQKIKTQWLIFVPFLELPQA